MEDLMGRRNILLSILSYMLIYLGGRACSECYWTDFLGTYFLGFLDSFIVALLLLAGYKSELLGGIPIL